MARRERLPVARSTVVVVAWLVAAAAAYAQTQSPPSIPERVAEMQHHFAQMTKLHEALIRGDLKGLLEPARELATTSPPVAFADKGAPFVEAIRQSAGRIGTATDLRAAATETVAVAGQCAGCHRAVGIFPSPASPRRPDVQSVAGHMFEHQRAADDMLQGLVIPSASRWQEAADRLEALALGPERWPRDEKLTEQVRRADVAVHALAEQARTANSVAARGSVYVDFVTTCASCHIVGGGAWGPRGRGARAPQ